jgi:hypothetical protein
MTGLLLGRSGQVASLRVSMSRHLAADRRRRAPQLLSNLSLRQSLRRQQPKLCPLLDAQA